MGVTIRPHVGSSHNYLLGDGVTAYRDSPLLFTSDTKIFNAKYLESQNLFRIFAVGSGRNPD